MKKWLDEEYEFEIEVMGFLQGEQTEHYCRNGEEIGDKYTCTYGCPVNAQGCGICSQGDDDPVPHHGGGPQRRRSGEHRRGRQVQQGGGLSRRLRDVPPYG